MIRIVEPFTVARAAWRLGVSVREYREIQAGERWPDWEAYDRNAETFGWPRSIASDEVPGEREQMLNSCGERRAPADGPLDRSRTRGSGTR